MFALGPWVVSSRDGLTDFVQSVSDDRELRPRRMTGELLYG